MSFSQANYNRTPNQQRTPNFLYNVMDESIRSRVPDKGSASREHLRNERELHERRAAEQAATREARRAEARTQHRADSPGMTSPPGSGMTSPTSQRRAASPTRESLAVARSPAGSTTSNANSATIRDPLHRDLRSGARIGLHEPLPPHLANRSPSSTFIPPESPASLARHTRPSSPTSSLVSDSPARPLPGLPAPRIDYFGVRRPQSPIVHPRPPIPPAAEPHQPYIAGHGYNSVSGSPNASQRSASPTRPVSPTFRPGAPWAADRPDSPQRRGLPPAQRPASPTNISYARTTTLNVKTSKPFAKNSDNYSAAHSTIRRPQ